MIHAGITDKTGTVLFVTLCLGIIFASVQVRAEKPGNVAPAASVSTPQNAPVGYTDTPFIPGSKWRVHDIDRPHPPVIAPGTASTPDQPGRSPSDAIVLFDGKDLSKWQKQPSANDGGNVVDAKWKVADGYLEVAGGTGSIVTREKFGDIQLHVEWASPKVVAGNSQGRGNSGVMFMGRYEIQVLDCWDNITYADGQASAIYGQYPPLVNPVRPPGEWQTYDIVFEAPRFEGEKLVKPAYFTVFFNGVLVHNHTASMGGTRHREVAKYEPHPAEGPILLQDHGNPVRYRNIWVRRLTGYDGVNN
jgi:hypothetical protein